jgi:methyltransferase (TIGR00027 family)
MRNTLPKKLTPWYYRQNGRLFSAAMENDGSPSQTALTAAAARAAHLVVDDEPWIFADHLAAVLLGPGAGELIGYHRAHGGHPVLSGARAQVTCRSRYVEDRLATLAARGLRQYVILGAGLDTFACRSALAGTLSVFEVDHPATQDWKRRRLAAAPLAVPPGTRLVPADLESGSLAGAVCQAGFDLSQPALVAWLGVTMYLTREAIGRVLADVGAFAPGTELVTDYMLPAGLRDAAGDVYVDLVAPASAERGEPWRTFLAPDDLTSWLERCGFGAVEHVQQRDAVPAAVWERTDALRPSRLSVLARATVRQLPG